MSLSLTSLSVPRNSLLRALPEFYQPPRPTASAVTLAIDKDDVFIPIHTLFVSFLEQAHVTAAQLAICRDGVVRFSRVYATRPPPGFLPVNAKTLFRLASCSKLFTCAAIESLRAGGKLDLEMKVFPLLKSRFGGKWKAKPDAHVDDITVRHLVDHAGGWNDHETVTAKDGTKIPGTDWDPVFRMREISFDLSSSKPPLKIDIARYMYGKPLQFPPGSQNFDTTHGKSYSNFGYLLLGLVVEALSGQPYIDYVRNSVATESERANIDVSRLIGGVANPREVWYLDPGSGPTVLAPASPAILPNAYGGGGFLPELMDSAGGVMTNAETLASFISKHAVWGLGGRAPGSGRTGGMPGTASYACSRGNGIDCAYILNTKSFPKGQKQQEDLMASLNTAIDKL